MIPKSKVLVLPSFYPIENDFSGNFFEEQARLINKSCLVVSVIYDEKRSLKHFSFKLFKNHYFQVTRSFEENVPVYRRHSWNIVPFRYSLGKYIWIKNTINLCEKYFREVGVPKLIHVHCALYAGEVALYLFEKYKIPFIITEHSTQFYEGSLTKNDISKLLPIYLSANKIIVVSSNFKYFLSEYLSIDLGRISVVPNFIDTDYFNPNALPANPIVKSQNIIFTVCNHNKRKRLDRLIEAFYSFKKQKDSQNWILYIGGSGPETSHLKNLCLKYNLETSIFFVGQLNKSQVRFYLNSSKFFVLSSDYETFGVVLIEAISMGKPVVSTRSGGVNDIVAPWNGILVDNNSQGLANGILLMASNYLNYNNKMVRSMGIKLFSGYAVANKYLKYYNEV